MSESRYPRRIELVQDMIAEDAASLLGEDIVETTPLHGGDLSEVVRVRTSSGHSFVAKNGHYPEREAGMLRALISAGADAPAPICSSAKVLVLEDLGPSAPVSSRAWQHLGKSLQKLHSVTGETYGWHEDYAFGRVPIRNSPGPSWPKFWIENRILVDKDQLPTALLQKLEAVAPLIGDSLPDAPPASLLHGDLWTRNIHFTSGDKAHLIDPACYFGHSEVDLAMLTLFGSPPQQFWSAYGPLSPGWELRRHIYQLWPALVHLRLFGEGYRPLVERLLDAVKIQEPTDG